MSFTDLLRAAWSTRVPSQCGKDWCFSVLDHHGIPGVVAVVLLDVACRK